MTEAATDSHLVDQVLSGDNPELQRLAATGILPLPREELIPLQVRLSKVENETIVELAIQSLSDLEPRIVQEYVRSEAGAEEVEYFARRHDHPSVLEAILMRRDLNADVLCEMAPRLTAELQEILLLRQDRIVDNPEILDALENNQNLSSYSQRRIGEYRMHLLGQIPAEPAPTTTTPPADGESAQAEEEAAAVAPAAKFEEGLTQEDFEEIDEVRDEVEPEGEVEDRTGLTESQIRSLSPSLRMKLCRGASRSLRSILIKDQNPNVATAVLQGSAFSESEIEQVSTNRNVVEEVLGRIANRREWIRKYSIMHNLVRNPRTPVAVALRCLPRLSLRDMAQLKMDRNVPDAVRQQAMRIHRAKTQK